MINFFSSSVTDILKFSLSISTKSIFPPQFKAQFAVATNVFGTVRLYHFFFTLRAKQAR